MASIIFVLIIGVFPAIFWLWFWLHEDKTRPEPKPLIGIMFLLGCLAIFPAYFLEKSLGADSNLLSQDNLLWVVILLATIEEGLKYAVVYAGALKTRFYDEPVDAMIYMVTTALGFAAVENVLFLLSVWFFKEITSPFTVFHKVVIKNVFRFFVFSSTNSMKPHLFKSRTSSFTDLKPLSKILDNS